MENEKLLKQCSKYGIAFLAVFGSFARGENTPKSDLDLLVRFSDRKSLLDMVRIEREMSESLGVKVDLLTENAISPYLREGIKKSMKVVYNSER